MPLTETLLDMPEQKVLDVDPIDLHRSIGDVALLDFTLLPGETIDSVVYPYMELPENRTPVETVLKLLVGTSPNGKLGGHPSLAALNPFGNEEVEELK